VPEKPKGEAVSEGEPTEAQKEAYRFKRKLKDGDQEYEVDLDEDAIARDVSIARAAKRRMGDINKRLADLDAREARIAQIEKDPLAYMKERGGDPRKAAAQLLAEEAQRGLMTPEEQRIRALEEENNSLKSWRQQQEEQRQAQEADRAEQERWKLKEPGFIKAMEKHKLPRDMGTLGFMAKVGEELERALGTDDVDPEIVVAETNERLGKHAERFVLSLPVEALAEKLGKERLGALMKLQMDRWRQSQAHADPVPREEGTPPPPVTDNEPKRYLSNADVEEKLRRIRERLRE
jgi:hypothetical protein